MKIPRPIITREHGAWAVLLVPIIVAASATNIVSIELILFVLAALGAFLSYVPAQILLRVRFRNGYNDGKLTASKFWLPVYASITFICLVWLLLGGYWFLLVIGMFGAVSFAVNFVLTRASGKTIASDLVAVLGLTLTAPGAYYVTTGRLDATAIMLWLLNSLFFCSSVFYVHMKIAARGLKSEVLSPRVRFQLGKLNILYHVAVFTIVMLLAIFQYTPLLMAVVFLPMVVHAVYGTLRLSSDVQFKRLGFLLLGHSITFALLFIIVKF
ncbi:MAG TPA: YwiC-like family protein [Bacteroidota bacterium]